MNGSESGPIRVALRLLPSYRSWMYRATMKELLVPRQTMHKSSNANNLLLLTLGAAAGLVAGVLLADRVGGLDRFLPGRRPGPSNSGGAEMDESELPYGLHDADGSYEEAHEDDEDEGDDLDQDELDDELASESSGHIHEGPVRGASRRVRRSGASDAQRSSAPDVLTLEARVLEAFHHDPVLRERAIDIGAIAAGVIELTGWVHSDHEVEHAITIAGGVPDVFHVVDQLAVRIPVRSRRATDARTVVQSDDLPSEAPPPRAD